MDGQDLFRKRILLDGREFSLTIHRFVNGCFLTVSEGVEGRIGGISVSLKRGGRVDGTTVIPARDGLLLNMIAELTANLVNGIVVVSYYSVKDVDSVVMKALLNEVKSFVKEVEAH